MALRPDRYCSYGIHLSVFGAHIIRLYGAILLLSSVLNLSLSLVATSSWSRLLLIKGADDPHPRVRVENSLTAENENNQES